MPRVVPPPLTPEDQHVHPVLGGGPGACFHSVICEAGGLTRVGVHLEVLPPGVCSSFRHWHVSEDEMVNVLTGELALVEDCETPLHEGEAACWPAGHQVGPCSEQVTDHFRLAEAALQLDEALICGRRVTHVMIQASRILPPFRSKISLRPEGNRWRAASIINALANSRWPLLLPKVTDTPDGKGPGQ